MKQKQSLVFKLSATFTLIFILACAVWVGTSALIFKEVNKTVEEVRYDDVLNKSVKSEVQSAISIVEHFYEEQQAGNLTENEAKEQAKEAVRSIRYNDDQGGYIWIDATDGTLIMHPILSDQEGTNRMELEDCNGVMILKKILEAADNGGGFNRFVFTKSDGVTEAEKVAYSEKFDAWGWVLTSGCYMDDIQAEMDDTKIENIFEKSVAMMLVESIVLIILTILITVFIVRKMMKGLKVIKESLEALSNGNLAIEFNNNAKMGKDEIGEMLNHTGHAVHNLNEMVREGLNTSYDVKNSSEKMISVTHSATEASNQISQAIEGVANDASTQVAEITEIMENISSMQNGTSEIQGAVNEIGNCAEELTNDSKGMRRNLQEMKKGSSDMTDQVNNISAKIEETNETIERMSEILSSIENIASETKLLSLNASIEAARAGESGKGFAVVAESIKSLSENTSNELSNIKEIIENLVENFNECDNCIKQVVETNQTSITDMEEVIEAFRTLDKQIEATGAGADTIGTVISRTIEEINNISNKMTDVRHGAENTAAASEEVTASIEELNSLMQVLDEQSSELNGKAEYLDQKLNQFKVS